MAETGALAYQEGPMDGSESVILNPMKAVRELGVEAFEETGVALLQTPEERRDYLKDEAARIDAAARHGRAPRFKRSPRNARPQGVETVDEELAVALAEGEPVGAESDIVTWRRHVVRSVREAGRRGTSDRRDTRDLAGREKPPFVGRYRGKCAVTSQVLREYDPSELGPMIETA